MELEREIIINNLNHVIQKQYGPVINIGNGCFPKDHTDHSVMYR